MSASPVAQGRVEVEVEAVQDERVVGRDTVEAVGEVDARLAHRLDDDQGVPPPVGVAVVQEMVVRPASPDREAVFAQRADRRQQHFTVGCLVHESPWNMRNMGIGTVPG
jgi:hypothetical protein